MKEASGHLSWCSRLSLHCFCLCEHSTTWQPLENANWGKEVSDAHSTTGRKGERKLLMCAIRKKIKMSKEKSASLKGGIIWGHLIRLFGVMGLVLVQWKEHFYDFSLSLWPFWPSPFSKLSDSSPQMCREKDTAIGFISHDQ